MCSQIFKLQLVIVGAGLCSGIHASNRLLIAILSLWLTICILVSHYRKLLNLEKCCSLRVCACSEVEPFWTAQREMRCTVVGVAVLVSLMQLAAAQHDTWVFGNHTAGSAFEVCALGSPGCIDGKIEPIGAFLFICVLILSLSMFCRCCKNQCGC